MRSAQSRTEESLHPRWQTRCRGRHLPSQAPETKNRVAPAISFSARTLALKESLKKASRSPDSEIKPIEMAERKPGKDAGHRLRRRRRVRLTKISPEALISTAINYTS